jgi:hypothetical protein
MDRDELIGILNELFEIFTFYRDYVLRYDGDPFGDSDISNELLDEGRENLYKSNHDKYEKGWNRFEELKQQYFKILRKRGN